MAKLSVILYVTIAIGILFLISRSPNHSSSDPPSSRLGHRRLKLRSNFTTPTSKLAAEHHHNHPHHHDPIPFDPLVAEMERHREDKYWERMYFEEHHKEFADHHDDDHHDPGHHDHGHQDHGHGRGHAEGHQSQPEWEDFMDAEDYLNDEERFNVTSRLILLFPKIDVDPVDGYVSERELTAWSAEQARKEVMHRTQREMEIHDKNKDGLIEFKEYEAPSWATSPDSNFGYEMGWWKEEHFNASDMNGDGLLNITEFNDFLHPADTKNPKLLKWLCQEEIRERDTDKDGKVNFNEFFHGLFDLVRNYEEESHNSSHNSTDAMEAPARKLFSELDKNGDGFLQDEEMLPIIGKLHPSESYYAKQQADYIISQADTNKDGRLSLAEMLENPFVFYSAVFNDEEDYDDHDELR